MTPSMRSCSTNQWRTSFSLLVLALPEPREAAPVSSTMAARPCRLEAGEDVLHPAPVGLVAGEARALGEAVEFVGVVVLFLEPVLVPHGIGDDAVEGLEAVALAELRAWKVSPISISPSMSWMIMFMLAMAQVPGSYSWP